MEEMREIEHIERERQCVYTIYMSQSYTSKLVQKHMSQSYNANTKCLKERDLYNK